MSRYIDAEDVKLLLWGYTNGDVDLLKKIDKIESKDVAPVIHARWTKKEIGTSKIFIFTCSHCGTEALLDDKYCSNCGAKMDENQA